MEEMDINKLKSFEFEQIFQYVDQVKELLSSRIWENILLDCSKNEIFILWLLYRRTEVNMTQVAEYIQTPLNTATGIIARMEKRGLVVRERSQEDKRVVTIRMGRQGISQMQDILKEIFYYGSKVMDSFSEEELLLACRMMNKVLEIMRQEKEKEQKPVRKVKKIWIE